jgi:PAS domain S-box-containing protein
VNQVPRLSTGMKIAVAFGATFLLAVLVGAVSWLSSLRLARDLDSITSNRLPCYRYVTAAYAAQNDVQAWVNGLALETEPERRRELEEDVDESFGEIEKAISAYAALPRGDAQERRWQELRGVLGAWNTGARAQRALEAERDRHLAHGAANDLHAATIDGLHVLRALDAATDDHFKRLIDQMNKDAEADREAATSAISAVKRSLVGVVLICGALTAALALAAARGFQRNEEARRRADEQRAFQLTLLDTLHDAVIGVDTAFRIRSWNKAAEWLYGWTAEEVHGREIEDVLGAGAGRKSEALRALQTPGAGERVCAEFVQRRRDGGRVEVQGEASAIRDSEGRITGYLLANRDVAERRRADEADAANRAKSCFLASMSHEIRTPLNAILGYAQLMVRDAALGAQARRNLDIINRSGEHLLALINDVLEMSKIEAGRMTSNPVTFDLHAMLGDLEAMFRLRAEAKGLDLEMGRDGSVPRLIVADEGKVRQVLVNLLGNAVKFTREGRVILRISTTPRPTEGLCVVADVHDTGVGIAAEEMGKLFQHFAQTESGRQAQAGTGLGLAISREHARVMGGDIHVKSDVGKGSTFRFAFVAGEAQANANARPAERGRVTGLKLTGPAPRVLIVDDQEANREWLRQLLEAIGFRVREAATGEEAIAIWRLWRPELVLMDLRMPGMDGHEATKRIRAEEGGTDPAIIALSASVLAGDREEVLASGADDFVGKPVREGELLEKIEAQLGLEYLRDKEPRAGAGAIASGAERLAPSALSAVPEAVLGAMREATTTCDIDRLRELIGDVEREAGAPVANALRVLADGFDLAALHRALAADGALSPPVEALSSTSGGVM